MLLTFGVWSSVSNVSNVDDRKILEYKSDNENKFTFKSMLETDPEEWDQLEGYNDFAAKECVEFENGTLTLRNIRVIGKWVAYEYSFTLYGEDFPGLRCINLNENIKHIIMEDSVSLPGNYIASYAFFDNWELKSIRIPKTVTSIGGIAYDESGTKEVIGPGYGAFELCTSLNSVTIPGSVTTIGIAAFCNCILLTSVTIPGSVTTIGDGAFNACTSLTSITIPGSVTTIGDYAFSGCESLTSVTIPGSVTTIGYGAFRGCTSLTSVTIPGSVTTIGYSAFRGCTSLNSVTIPGSVTTIGNDAFDYCTSLATVIIDARNSSFDTLEYASFPKELQYIITTGNTMNNYLIGKCLSNDNNIDIPSDDTYYEFEVEYTSNVNTRRIKSISDVYTRYLNSIDPTSTESPVTVVSTPA